jgi:flagellar basal-body rod protein FlgF
MENTIYIGLSRQVALSQQMSIVANNVANVNTPGFRADKVLFEEYVTSPKPTKEDISMVLDYGQFKDKAPGKVSFTGNALDVALEGPGFMMVETSEGTKYTRAGNFTLDNLGTLVTASGNPVLNAGQGRITIPEGAKDIVIGLDGQIATDQGVIGDIGVVEFANPNNLRSTGDGFYVTVDNEAAVPQANTTVRQNMIEGSNVQAVLEMTDLIEVSRQFQSMQRMLQNEHERQSKMIDALSSAN